MATAPNPGLPLFYNEIQPLSSQVHGSWRTGRLDSAPFLARTNVVPLTVEEFSVAQRFYPIIFSVGENPVPLALMGLNDNVNVFVDENDKVIADIYLPAYVRRYPFLLARLSPDTDDLSLCFDPTANAIGPFDEGDPLFQDGQPTDTTKQILQFCENVEQSGMQTAAFMKELAEHNLLIPGEVGLQPQGASQPFVYRGFQMISEEAVKNLRGDVARKMIQNGMMSLIFAHLFSLPNIQEIFGRQMQLGKIPLEVLQATA